MDLFGVSVGLGQSFLVLDLFVEFQKTLHLQYLQTYDLNKSPSFQGPNPQQAPHDIEDCHQLLSSTGTWETHRCVNFEHWERSNLTHNPMDISTDDVWFPSISTRAMATSEIPVLFRMQVMPAFYSTLPIRQGPTAGDWVRRMWGFLWVLVAFRFACMSFLDLGMPNGWSGFLFAS